MTSHPTHAERVDRAVDELLGGASPAAAAASAGLEARDRRLVDAAAALRSALGTSLVGPRFEARLGARLSGAAGAGSPWILRHPGRLIVTGAVGSALGFGVTAFAVWRSGRRSMAHRLLHR